MNKKILKEQDIPDLNIFMMCDRLNTKALSKLSEEFYTSGHSVKHMFTLKIEDNGWANKSSWCDFYPTGAAGFSPENTDNGWIHVEIDLSTKSDYSSLAVGTNVLTFGFFGITQTTRQTAYIIMDNIALTAKA